VFPSYYCIVIKRYACKSKRSASVDDEQTHEFIILESENDPCRIFVSDRRAVTNAQSSVEENISTVNGPARGVTSLSVT
jgi:hypothetical protein